MRKPPPAARHYESATEEFERRVRELYALADKMGRRISIIVKKKPDAPIAQPAQGKPQSRREPGEN